MVTTTTTTATKVTTGDLFFLGGVRGAGVPAFLLLRLAGLSVSRLLRAIATASKIEIRIYRGAGPSALAESRFSPMVVTHILIYSSIL